MKIGISSKFKTGIIKDKRIDKSLSSEIIEEDLENGDEDIWEEYFFSEAFYEYNSLIAYRYFRLYILLKENQQQIVLFKLREFIEVILKFPVIIIANYIWEKEKISVEEKEIIKYIIERPTGLLQWEDLANKILEIYKDELKDVDCIYHILVSLCNIYRSHKIVQWLDESMKKLFQHQIRVEAFFKKTKDILLVIKDHMEKFEEEYISFKLYDKNNKILKGNSNIDNLLSNKEELYIDVGEKIIYIHPFRIVKNRKIKGIDLANDNKESYSLQVLRDYKLTGKQIIKVLNAIEEDNRYKKSYYLIDCIKEYIINKENSMNIKISHKVKVNEEKNIDRVQIDIKFQLDRLREIYKNKIYYKGMLRLITIVSILEEPVDFEEILYLYGEEDTNLSCFIYMVELSYLLEIKDKNERVFISIVEEYKEDIIEENKELIALIVKEWFQKVQYEIIAMTDNKVIYLCSHIYEYVSKYYKVALKEIRDESYIEQLLEFIWKIGYVTLDNYKKEKIIRICNYIIEAKNELSNSVNSKDIENLIILYNYRAIIYSSIACYEEAVKDYDKAIEIIDKNKEIKNNERVEWLAKVYINKGVNYDNSKNYEKAVQEYEKALELLYSLDKGEDKNSIAILYIKKSISYLCLNYYEGALDSFKKSLDIINIMIDEKEFIEAKTLIKGYNLIRTMKSYVKQSMNTLKEYKKVIEVIKKLSGRENPKSQYGLAMIYSNKGDDYRKIGSYENALKEYHKSLEMMNKLPCSDDGISFNDISVIHAKMGVVYEVLEDWINSVKMFQIALNYMKVSFKEEPWLQNQYYYCFLKILYNAPKCYSVEGLEKLIEIYYEPIKEFIKDDKLKEVVEGFKKTIKVVERKSSVEENSNKI